MRARVATGSSGVKLPSGDISSRYSVMTVRIDDDRAVMVERGHDPIWIEFEIFRLELIAFEQIEPYLIERQLAWPLRTKRTRWLQVDCGAL